MSDGTPELPVDATAKRLLQQRDFSHNSCEEIVRRVCQECQSGRKRKVHAGTCSVALGAYSHANHYGIIKKGFTYPNVVRYINKLIWCTGTVVEHTAELGLCSRTSKDAHNSACSGEGCGANFPPTPRSGPMVLYVNKYDSLMVHRPPDSFPRLRLRPQVP